MTNLLISVSFAPIVIPKLQHMVGVILSGKIGGKKIPYTPKPVTPVDTVVKDEGLSIIVFGVGGSGKSWFGINTADVAEPLYLLNFDRTVDHLLKRYPGKEYFYEKFVPDDKATALRDLAKVMDVVQYAVRKGSGVFVIDNVAALWSLVCKAYLPDKDKPLPRDYGTANDWMRELCLTLEDSKLFTIFTTPAAELWVG